MKRSWMSIGLGLVCAFSLLLNSFFVIQSYNQNIVISVHDGDTFTVKEGSRIKLIGVNAPELSNCFGEDAKLELSKLVLGKHVRLTDEKRDTYGRKMALVSVGETLVNERLLAGGFARADYTPNSQSEKLKNAYTTASEEKIGLHSVCRKENPTPPSPACTIKGNIDPATNSKLYHLPTCRHYSAIVLSLDRGESFFCSEEEAKEAGFRIAPDCLR